MTDDFTEIGWNTINVNDDIATFVCPCGKQYEILIDILNDKEVRLKVFPREETKLSNFFGIA